jgi:hypothetical protein
LGQLAVVGVIVMVVSETATLFKIEPFYSWNTPIAWTGFILFADAIVRRARGSSWIGTSPREFTGLAVASIPLWLVFEGYNRLIKNWYYVGLPDNLALRYFGYAWSFATIWPAIFEGAELISVGRGGQGGQGGQGRTAVGLTARRDCVPDGWRTNRTAPSRSAWIAVIVGLVMVVWPILRPSPYLAAPVWMGFVLLLDPINSWLGGESLLDDWRSGRYNRFVNLVLSGFLCGVLWEFLNYWSRSKWHYTVPIMENVKIFEMPLPGYFGFPAFALECFTMYVFVRLIWIRLTRTLVGGSGRAIAL